MATIQIDTSTQLLTCGEYKFPVATAKKGTGQKNGSWQTPLGQHHIHAKIGEGLPENAVLVGREWTGEIYSPKLAEQYPDRDWILTRILWLAGDEPGFNQGGEVDTKNRYIYIHGAPDEATMGIPSSHGCIRMRNQDLLALFDHVHASDSVDII